MECVTDVSPPGKSPRSLDLSQIRGISEKLLKGYLGENFPKTAVVVLVPTPPTPVQGGGRGRQSLLSELGSYRERHQESKTQRGTEMDRDRDRDSVSELTRVPWIYEAFGYCSGEMSRKCKY